MRIRVEGINTMLPTTPESLKNEDGTTSLDMYVAGIRVAADRFQFWYNGQNHKDPDNFPLKLSDEEWEKRFSAWLKERS